MTSTDFSRPRYTGGSVGVSALYRQLGKLTVAMRNVEAFNKACGDVKGALLGPWRDAKQCGRNVEECERLADWYHVRHVLGEVVLPHARQLRNKVLDAGCRLEKENGSSHCLAVLLAVQRAFEEGKFDQLIKNADGWQKDDYGIDDVIARFFQEQCLARLGRDREQSFISSRLMGIHTMLPLELQFFLDEHGQGSPLVLECLQLYEAVVEWEDNLKSLIALSKMQGGCAITFTRMTTRRSEESKVVEDYPEFHSRIAGQLHWWQHSTRDRLRKLIADDAQLLDKSNPELRNAHNLIGAQVLFNHLCTLYDVSMLHTVRKVDDMVRFCREQSTDFQAWRATKA